jgi:hypothetical protein
MSQITAERLGVRRARSRRTVVVIEETPEALAAVNPANRPGLAPIGDESVLESLMVPLAMVVLDKLDQRTPEVALAERDHVVESLLSDRSYESLRVGIGVGA